MSALIKIDTAIVGNEEVNAVNARELYSTLEVKKDFSNWIKQQISSLGLEENTDYITTPQKRGVANGGYKMVTEYILTLDAAKHIAMASRTPKGKEVRAYFIEVEKQFRVGIKQYKALEEEKQEIERKYYEQLELTNKLLLEKIESKTTPEPVESKKDALPSKSAKIMIAKRRTKWSDEEVETLIELYNRGLNYREIGKILGRSQKAVNSKIQKIRASL